MTQTVGDAGKMLAATGDDKDNEEDEEDEDDDVDEIPESLFKQPEKAKGARASVLAEAYGAWNQKTAFAPPMIETTVEQKAQPTECLRKRFLFSGLEEKEFGIVLGAIAPVVKKVSF